MSTGVGTSQDSWMIGGQALLSGDQDKKLSRAEAFLLRDGLTIFNASAETVEG